MSRLRFCFFMTAWRRGGNSVCIVFNKEVRHYSRIIIVFGSREYTDMGNFQIVTVF